MTGIKEKKTALADEIKHATSLVVAGRHILETYDVRISELENARQNIQQRLSQLHTDARKAPALIMRGEALLRTLRVQERDLASDSGYVPLSDGEKRTRKRRRLAAQIAELQSELGALDTGETQ